jgi:hypothetical protein
VSFLIFVFSYFFLFLFVSCLIFFLNKNNLCSFAAALLRKSAAALSQKQERTLTQEKK